MLCLETGEIDSIYLCDIVSIELLQLISFSFFLRKQAKKEATQTAGAADDLQDPKDFVDERALHWANYTHGPYPHHPRNDSIPHDPRDPHKDAHYAHGRMHPNDYGLRHHIYESPHFT